MYHAIFAAVRVFSLINSSKIAAATGRKQDARIVLARPSLSKA